MDSASLLDYAIVFMVVNARPERRSRVHLPHSESVRTTVNVALCTVVCAPPRQVIVHLNEGDYASLDLRAFVCDEGAALSVIRRWYTSKTRSALQQPASVSLGVCCDTYPLPIEIGAASRILELLSSVPEVSTLQV